VVVDTLWLAFSAVLGVVCTLPLAWLTWRVLEGNAPDEAPMSEPWLPEESTFPPAYLPGATLGVTPQLRQSARSITPVQSGLIPVWAPLGASANLDPFDPRGDDPPPRLSVRVTPAPDTAPSEPPAPPVAPPDTAAEAEPVGMADTSMGLQVAVTKAVRVPPQPEDPTVLIEPVQDRGPVAESWFR